MYSISERSMLKYVRINLPDYLNQFTSEILHGIEYYIMFYCMCKQKIET